MSDTDGDTKVQTQDPASAPDSADQADARGQPPRLAVAVAIATRRVDDLPALRLAAAEQLRHFRLEEILHPCLDLCPGPRLQGLPTET